MSDDGYDLSFREDGGQYAYSGSRTTDDDKYVLVFDPTREVFVLHKVDSTFSMNVTQTPDNNDPESLRRKHPHLAGSSSSGGSKARSQKSAPTASTKSRASASDKKSRDGPFLPKKSKPAAQQQKAAQAVLSSSSASKQNRAAATATPVSHDDGDDDDSSDDGLLQIEEPGGPNAPPASARDFSPAFGIRKFSDFVQTNTEEEDDADGEDDDDNQSIEHFTLPSPVNRQMEESAGLSSQRATGTTHDSHQARQQQYMKDDEEEEEEEEEVSDEDADAEMEDVQHHDQQNVSMDHDMDDAAAEADLEAELLAAFEEEMPAESDVSEEE